MAKITIEFDENKESVMMSKLFAIVQEAEKIKEEVCALPDKEEKNEAQRISERQQYCICLINSAKKVLENLQLELAKESIRASALVRRHMRELGVDITDAYLFDSRKLLSKEVNTPHTSKWVISPEAQRQADLEDIRRTFGGD